MSYKIINKIINNKKINLVTSISESFNHHKILIDIFSSHLKRINIKKN